jgi:hypothetical protein
VGCENALRRVCDQRDAENRQVEGLIDPALRVGLPAPQAAPDRGERARETGDTP